MNLAHEPPRIAGPVPHPHRPREMPPPGAWDTHAHIFKRKYRPASCAASRSPPKRAGSIFATCRPSRTGLSGRDAEDRAFPARAGRHAGPILERYTKAALAVLSQDDIKNRVVQPAMRRSPAAPTRSRNGSPRTCRSSKNWWPTPKFRRSSEETSRRSDRMSKRSSYAGIAVRRIASLRSPMPRVSMRRHRFMDCRIKPGNDDEGVYAAQLG